MKKGGFIFLFVIAAFNLVAQTSRLEALQKQQQALKEEIRNTNQL